MTRPTVTQRHADAMARASAPAHGSNDAPPNAAEATPSAAAQAPPTAAAQAPPRARPGLLATVFLGGLFVFASVGTLIVARAALVPMVAAALLAMTLMPAVKRLRNAGLAHWLAATLVAAALVAGLVALAYLLLDPLGNALNALPQLDGLGLRLGRLARRVLGEPYTNWVGERLREAATGAGWSGRFLSGVGETLLSLATTIVLTYFLLLSGNLFLQRLVQVLPRVRDKVKAVKVVNDVQDDVARYFATVTVINIVVGIITGVIAWYWELPAPLLLGVLAALFNYIPYVGAVANVLLILLASGATYTAFGEILAAPAVFCAVAALEGNFITPLIVGRRTQLNAVTVVFGLVFWAWVWGIAGMVLAIPLLLVVKGFATHIERLDAVNAFLSR